MTYWPLKPQQLSPGVPAPDTAPQTQFLTEDDPASKYTGAQAAIAAYAAAEAAGQSSIPPAAIAYLVPAGTVPAAS